MFQSLEPKAASITLTEHKESIGTEAVQVLKMDQITGDVINLLFESALAETENRFRTLRGRLTTDFKN